MPQFERYIGIDYSGAETAEAAELLNCALLRPVLLELKRQRPRAPLVSD
jgi:hypothetical protein